MKTLDLACGGTKSPDAVGIDRLPLPGVDFVHDLDTFPYPFDSDTFDRVICLNGMEHLDRPLDVLAELHRISRPGALIHIASPHFSSVDFFTDPTHRHPFSSRSFDYLVPGTQAFGLQYNSAARFAKLGARVTFALPCGLNRLARWLANHNLERYERHFAFIMPAHQILFDLQVLKDG
jgi:SAM-dependent methyltransferase